MTVARMTTTGWQGLVVMGTQTVDKGEVALNGVAVPSAQDAERGYDDDGLH